MRLLRGRPVLTDLLIGAIALGVLLGVHAVLPDKAFADFVIRGAAMALFATSLNLLVGGTGLVSFGHGMFYGLGAYAFALLMQLTSLPMPLALLGALLIVAATALVIGAICIRLRTIYFAFVTLAMQMLLHSIIISAVALTGGDQGLQGGIPRRVVFGADLGQQGTLYAVSATAMVIGLLLMRHVSRSPLGASMRMVRDNETRAAFLGIVIWRVKLTAFVIAAVFAGLGGAVIALFVSGAYPELIDWPITGQAIFAIMLGGIRTFLGPLAGVIILQVLNDVTTRLTEYYGLVLGIVILLFAVGLRRGVLDVLVRRAQ
jgi:branched-chain amino acid transport system permease protein